MTPVHGHHAVQAWSPSHDHRGMLTPAGTPPAGHSRHAGPLAFAGAAKPAAWARVRGVLAVIGVTLLFALQDATWLSLGWYARRVPERAGLTA